MGTEAISKVIMLAAKTGLFFAKADGQYDVAEKQFIESFIDKLAAIGPVDEVKENLEGLLQRNITLEEIDTDTDSLLSEFNGLERMLVQATLTQFVQRVIAADGQKHEKEAALFEAWKKAIKD